MTPSWTGSRWWRSWVRPRARCWADISSRKSIFFPNDVQEMEAVETPAHAHATIHSGTDFHDPLIVPAEADLERAAQILNEGSKVAILVGAGAWNAADEVIAVAEALQAGVAKALLGKAVLPDALSY